MLIRIGRNINKNTFFTSSELNNYSIIMHRFGTRRDGLIPGRSTDANYLELCREKAAETIGMSSDDIVCLEQVHSNNVIEVNKGGVYRNADGVISDTKGIYLTIQTADCAPIFLFAPKQEVIAAVHGGWRGIAGDILFNAIKMLHNQYQITPAELKVTVGPSLKKCCFEIGTDVLDIFEKQFIISQNKRYYLDFSNLIKSKLLQAGIENNNIEIIQQCTMCNNDIFYSYREDNQQTGRMLNIIGMEMDS